MIASNLLPRIAILAHSTNPRGGVVHGLELADSLTRLGYEAVIHAPDASGKGFFRAPLSPAIAVMASLAGKNVAEMVQARIADYIKHFELSAHRQFDVFHAQDSISGNALATLKQRGLIRRFARTVHHIDNFQDPRLSDWQTRSITEADELFVVSELWQSRIMAEFGRASTKVGNASIPNALRTMPARSTSRCGINMASMEARCCFPWAASRNARTALESSKRCGSYCGYNATPSS
jgi:hypothetical protein